MASRKDLTLEQKINLIKENERGSSYRILKEKFNVSVGNISNILKRKNEYLDEDEFSRNNNSEKILLSDGFSKEYKHLDEDTLVEEPSSLTEALQIVRRLRLLSTTQYPEMHFFVIQLQNKPIEICLDENRSRQTTLYEYFRLI